MADPLLTRMMLDSIRTADPGWTTVAEGLRAAMVAHAVSSCPYWAEVARPGTPWEEIPSLTKALLRSRWDDLQARGVPDDQRFEGATSGSTGEAAHYANDRTAVAAHLAGWDAFRVLGGISILTPNIFLVTRQAPGQTFPPPQVPYMGAELVPELIPTLVAAWSSADGPYAVQSRSSMLEWIAHEMRTQGLRFTRPPAVVFASQDQLTQHGRRAISETFECPVRSWYGGQETCGMLATTLDDGEQYAFNPLLAHVEVVDEDDRHVAPGEQGRILVTDLHNQVCPIIRYDTGDLAVWSAERRGSWPVVERLEGRSAEMVRLPSGKMISTGYVGFWLFSAADVTDLVSMWQCEQIADDALRLRVVWRKPPTDADVARVRDALLVGMDPGMRVEVVSVDRLLTLPSGKRWTLRRAPEADAGAPAPPLTV